MDYKLMCFGTHENNNPRCGVCQDEGTCECETKWKEANENDENEKNKQR